MSQQKKNYVPSRGVERACGGIIESVDRYPYSAYVELAGTCIGKNWNEEQRKNLFEAIKLNLINKKEYPFNLLQRKYRLPCTDKAFRKEARLYVQILAGLCGFE